MRTGEEEEDTVAFGGAEDDAEDDPDDDKDEADEEGRGVLASDAKGKRGGRRDVAIFGG